MKKTRIETDLSLFPAEYCALLEGVALYDSSCSPQAKVYFADRDGGIYLKKSPKGSLQAEAAMNRFFWEKGFGPEVLRYDSWQEDWLVTRQVPGEDCTHAAYLEDPKRLCDTTALLLRQLHETPIAGCPMENRTRNYLQKVRENYEAGCFDQSLFPDNWGYVSAEEAWKVLEENGKYLKADTLLHGDYCLPNIVLENWQLSGFIDLGSGGVGDRHVDLFWGSWTLFFNLKTDRYRERFLDAYGRDKVQQELVRVVAAAEVFG